MRGKEIIFETTESGCIVPTSHKLNQDGYFRTRDYRVVASGRKPLIMNHRLKWEERHGKIPAGFEVDHLCRNRACCNTEHLQLLTVSEHKVKTNKERSDDLRVPAKEYWLSTKCSGITLGKQFGVSFSTACKWIREWKV